MELVFFVDNPLPVFHHLVDQAPIVENQPRLLPEAPRIKIGSLESLALFVVLNRSERSLMTANDKDRRAPGDPREVAPPACPVCGAPLVEIRSKLICSRCHTVCETCCEGGRG